MILAAVILASALLSACAESGSDDPDEKDRMIESLESENADKSRQIDQLQTERDALRRESDSLKERISELESEQSESGIQHNDELSKLREELAAKSSEIAELEADIAKYQTVFAIDVREQAQLIDVLVEYINNECPVVRQLDGEDEKGEPIYKWTTVEELIEEGKAAAEESGEEYVEDSWREREDIVFPKISVYYEDLSTGYHFGENEDEYYDAASVIKAPYIMSVLETISKDEKAFRDKMAAEGKPIEKVDNDGDGVAESDKIEFSNPIYDLSEKITYNKEEMFKPGSGKIQTMEDGTVFTYTEFVQYALEYSDNIAYQALRKRFGYSTMTSLASRVGAKSVLAGKNSMSARDAGRLFKEIYRFVQNDDKYGKLLKNSMLKANHTVIIPAGAYPTKVMHKYGWDTGAYHDAGIVLAGEHPYVVAVFTDLDVGGDEVNEYLKGLVKKINTLHTNFYKQ